MAPFNLTAALGNFHYLVYLLLGIGFGWILESSGFGDSRQLAAQFYFKNMRVLKVMFTAILTAMVLIFASVQWGLLDFQKIWVNPTFLSASIAGGLIMGVGFIIGGFCPGTSLVAAATLKLDGIFFVLGVLLGVGLFGETVASFDSFWTSMDFGRFTLAEYFNVPAGIVVFSIVAGAILLFYGVEWLEAKLNQRPFDWRPTVKYRWLGAAYLIGVSAVIFFQGAPSYATRWERIRNEKGLLLTDRAVYIHPIELRRVMDNTMFNLKIYDLRSEAEFNRLHLRDAQLTTPAQMLSYDRLRDQRNEPNHTVRILVDSNEELATETWKSLTTESISNIYILEGGMPAWQKHFTAAIGGHSQDHLSLGGRSPLSYPIVENHGKASDNELNPAKQDPALNKIKVETKKAIKGGCG